MQTDYILYGTRQLRARISTYISILLRSEKVKVTEIREAAVENQVYHLVQENP
jgi:hypothetical protein